MPKALLGSKRVPRKTLKQCVGLLIWATSIALHPRSWLAPLYSDLNSPPGSMHSKPPQMWSAFRASLKTSHSLPSLWAPKFLKFQAAPHTALRTSRVCQAPANPRITPILASCVQHSLGAPAASTGSCGCLCRRRLGRSRGLGNYFITSGLVCQNLEHAGHTGMSSLDSGASHVSETLAQLSLLQATHSHIGGGHYSFSMPSGTDNSATEASLNKLFTTSWPF